jgi:hypothetical protein
MKPMRFPPEILSDVVKHAAPNTPQIVTLSAEYSWAALQGLYERVELKELYQANAFFQSIKNTCITRKILTRHRRGNGQYPAFATLVKTLYISFDHYSHLHFGAYKHGFRLHFNRHIPMMTSLEHVIIGVHEAHLIFSTISCEDTVYPTSVRTLRIVSMDVDFYKVNSTTYS